MDTVKDYQSEVDERAELLLKLEDITLAVFMTVLPSEMALEIETMTSEGTSYQWIGYDDWNVYCLYKCDTEQWEKILSLLESKTLLVKDLDDTDLGKFVSKIEPEADIESNCSSLLAGLLKVASDIDSKFYCYCENDIPQFFSSIENLKAGIKDNFPANTYWDDMDTDRLRDFLERYEEDGDSFPVITFADDDEDYD